MRSALVNSPAGAPLSLGGIQTSRPRSPAHACGPAPGLCKRVVPGAASLGGETLVPECRVEAVRVSSLSSPGS